jgi:hypothetical protein
LLLAHNNVSHNRVTLRPQTDTAQTGGNDKVAAAHPAEGESRSLPSHRNLKKVVGNSMKTCHTAGDE